MRKEQPPFCVLKAGGTNCDRETAYALQAAQGLRLANAAPQLVHINELKAREKKLSDYQGLIIPGGFADGDYGGGAGRIFALNLIEYLRDEIVEFKEKGKLILGVCNGFQVLVRTGLLPFGEVGKIKAALDQNNSGHFECRWVNLRVERQNACVFLGGMRGNIFPLQVAHGEGKFYTERPTLQEIERKKLVVFRYCDPSGKPIPEYPLNPNGSLHAIAGICDPSGRILGLMPHPERSVQMTHDPNWRRNVARIPHIEPAGLSLFKAMVSYASQI